MIGLFDVDMLWISDSENFSYLIRKSSSSAIIDGANYVSILKMSAGAGTKSRGELKLGIIAGKNIPIFGTS